MLQKPVKTSELMMLDRIFVNEEQQSLIMLRQDLEEGRTPEILQSLHPQPVKSQHHHQSGDGASCSADQSAEEYDEWACIQRELGCLPPTTTEGLKMQHPVIVPKSSAGISTSQVVVTTAVHSTPITTTSSMVST